MKLQFILFDLIGTTIQDSNANNSIILESFQQAFQQHGISVSKETLNHQRGKRKREAISVILEEAQLGSDQIDNIYTSFLTLLTHSISSFSEIPKAQNVFKIVKAKGIKIGIGSGLPLSFMKTLLSHLGWKKEHFHYIGSSEDLPAGRPSPIMILEAMKQLGITNTREVLKIGDTKVDVLEGKNAKVKTAFVQTGTQSVEGVIPLQPDYIFDSIADLIPLLVERVS